MDNSSPSPLPYLSFPTPTLFLSFISFLRFFPRLFFKLERVASWEWRHISDRVTRDNDLQRDKKAFTTQPRQTGWEEKDEKERCFYICVPLITRWQGFGSGAAPFFSLCHDLAERREAVFLQFPALLPFFYYLFNHVFTSLIHFLPVFLLDFLHCVLAFLSVFPPCNLAKRQKGR